VLLLFLILEFFNIELKWDHNFLEEKSKKWRLKNPQKTFPKLTYYVFFDMLNKLFYLSFFEFFFFFMKRNRYLPSLQKLRNFTELLK